MHLERTPIGAVESQPHMVGWRLGVYSQKLRFPVPAESSCLQGRWLLSTPVISGLGILEEGLLTTTAQPLPPIPVLHSPDIKHPLYAQRCSGCGNSAEHGPCPPRAGLCQNEITQGWGEQIGTPGSRKFLCPNLHVVLQHMWQASTWWSSLRQTGRTGVNFTGG